MRTPNLLLAAGLLVSFGVAYATSNATATVKPAYPMIHQPPPHMPPHGPRRPPIEELERHISTWKAFLDSLSPEQKKLFNAVLELHPPCPPPGPPPHLGGFPPPFPPPPGFGPPPGFPPPPGGPGGF
jgi:hypothetical protein